jgi:hypothetical protein
MDNPYNNPYVLTSRLRTTGMQAMPTTTVDMDHSLVMVRRAIITTLINKVMDTTETTVTPIVIRQETTLWTVVPVWEQLVALAAFFRCACTE